MLKSFLSDRSGNFATTLVVILLPLFLAIGLSVDLSRYIAAKSRDKTQVDATTAWLTELRSEWANFASSFSLQPSRRTQ